MNLQVAIQKITDEYTVPTGQTADPGEVAWEVRGALTQQDLDAWAGTVAPELIEAYRLVLTADTAEITRALS